MASTISNKIITMIRKTLIPLLLLPLISIAKEEIPFNNQFIISSTSSTPSAFTKFDSTASSITQVVNIEIVGLTDRNGNNLTSTTYSNNYLSPIAVSTPGRVSYILTFDIQNETAWDNVNITAITLNEMHTYRGNGALESRSYSWTLKDGDTILGSKSDSMHGQTYTYDSGRSQALTFNLSNPIILNSHESKELSMVMYSEYTSLGGAMYVSTLGVKGTIPEPGTTTLSLLAFAGLIFHRRRTI